MERTYAFVKHVYLAGKQKNIYKVHPPLVSGPYVLVSAVNVPVTGPETYIFACSPAGEVTNWVELPGSFRGGLDPEKAIRGLCEAPPGAF